MKNFCMRSLLFDSMTSFFQSFAMKEGLTSFEIFIFNFVPRWRENEAQLDWGANESSCLFLFPFNVLLKFFSSQIELEAKLISFDTDWFGEAIVEYCFLTPKWVHNSADNNGKKVDTQNVDLPKKCCFLHARWVLTFTGNPSGK